MKSNGNSFGQCASGVESAPANAATPLITTQRPPQADHWWYLV